MNFNDEISQFLLYDKVGVLTLNKDGKVLRVSKSASSILKIPSFELAGSYIQDISIPLDTNFNIIFAICKNIGVMENIPVTFIKGDYKPRTTVAYLYLQKEGEDFNFRFIFIDRTYETEIRNLIVRQSHELQIFIDAISDPLLSIDLDYNIIRANRECERLSNIPIDVLLGLKCYEVLYQRNTKCENCLLDMVLENNSVSKLTKYIRDFKYNVIGYPLTRPDGTIAGTIEYLRPVCQDLAGLDKYYAEDKNTIICSKCKKVKTLTDDWIDVEDHLNAQLNLVFSHSYCPDCSKLKRK